MLTNYYTLLALVDEWKPRLLGARLIDGYSQHKGSLILSFESKDDVIWSLNTSVQAPNRHLFMYAGTNRSRKNVIDVFPALRSQVVSELSLSPRDRHLYIGFENGARMTILVFGPSANVFLQQGDIEDAFRNTRNPIPASRPAPPLPNADQINHHLASGRPLKSMIPLFPGMLLREVAARSGGTDDPATIAQVLSEIESELLKPTPRIYWDSARKPTLSLVSLTHLDTEEERVSSIDEAVRIVARRRLAIHRFSGTYDPLLRMLKKRVTQTEKSLVRVKEELSNPGRAAKHEHTGHLLMAQSHAVKLGTDFVVLPDILGDGTERTIALDPRLSPIENAQAYYEKAKRSRVARQKAEERIQGLNRTAVDTKRLYEEALDLKTVEEVKAFQSKHKGHLKALMAAPEDPDNIPYRRYVLDEGYEVWVGRNAKQNDQLTLHDARKYDLWLHARGVAGSHTVLKLRGRTDQPPKHIVEQAASIAAWHSKSRTSGLAPVIVVEKKHVRKPRKALPGAVVVEREKVLLVEPGLPD